MTNIYLIDTNVLIYAIDERSKYHIDSVGIFEQAKKDKFIPCISYQSILECYAIITDARRVRSPLNPVEALALLTNNYLDNPLFLKIHQRSETAIRALSIAVKHRLSKQRIFDALLIQTMLDNEVRQIVTYNVKDFKHFREIRAIQPSVLLVRK